MKKALIIFVLALVLIVFWYVNKGKVVTDNPIANYVETTNPIGSTDKYDIYPLFDGQTFVSVEKATGEIRSINMKMFEDYLSNNKYSKEYLDQLGINSLTRSSITFSIDNLLVVTYLYPPSTISAGPSFDEYMTYDLAINKLEYLGLSTEIDPGILDKLTGVNNIIIE